MIELKITAKATKISEPIIIITNDAGRAAHYTRLLKGSGNWRDVRVNGRSI